MEPALTAPLRQRWWLLLAGFIVAAFLIRARSFGNPILHVDEDFYLLVADRMLHGAVPYVDIWDRKPIGLFLLYAAIRLLGGDGILQYQVVATLFAAATATLVALMASRIASRGTGIVAGLVYLLSLGLFGGGGGQSPIFYNLLMAGAAMLVMQAWLSAEARVIRGLGFGAMVLIGLALQIKYSVVFEGLAFGLILIARSWRVDPRPGPRLADAALWVAVALLPTALAWGWYAAHGWNAQFVYANFTSILDRGHEAQRKVLNRLGWSLAPLAPLLLTVLVSEWILTTWRVPWRERPRGTAIHHYLLLWLAAAFAGYFLFGTYFDHYMLPVLVPLSILAAPLFVHRRRLVGPAFAIFLLLFGYGGADIQRRKAIKMRGDAAYFHQAVAIISPHLASGLYVFDGETMLYYWTGAPIPTRWAFPNHLNLAREAPAIGIDPDVEVTRIFGTRPGVVVDTDTYNDDINERTRAIARRFLARDYRPIARLTLNPEEARMIYLRNDLR